MISRGGERGSVAIEFPFIIGLVLIPFGIFLLSVSTWVERQTAARDASSEVARALVVDPDTDVDGLLRQIEQGYGLATGSLELTLSGSGEPGSDLQATVAVSMPGAVLPLLGPVGDVRWEADHVERVPDFGATE